MKPISVALMKHDPLTDDEIKRLIELRCDGTIISYRENNWYKLHGYPMRRRTVMSRLY